MVALAQLEELSRFNAAAVASIPVELRALRSSLAGASAEVSRDALLEVAPGLVDRHGALVAAGSAEWFERVRRSEVGGSFAARLGVLPDPDVVRRNVRWAAGALFEDGRVSPFETLAGSLSRQVLDVGRGTIRENVNRDPRAVGWNRIARADGCDFCVMLAGRGGVYKKATADFASHDHCKCRAAPSWDPTAPEVDARAYEASKKTSGMSPAQKARHQKNVNEWLDANRWRLDELRAELL